MGRYIKYEIKGSYKFILGVLALVLILTTGIYTYGNNANGASALGGTFIGLSTLVIFGTLLTTFLYIVGSFRKELYEDRGYLTFTLPLTGHEILGAKLIVATMWFLILGVVILGYNIVMAMNLDIVKESIDGMNVTIKVFPELFNRGMVMTFILMLLGGISTLILIYLSMALGRVTLRNKKIGGFWFIIFLVLSVLVGVGQAKVISGIPYYLDLNTFKIISYESFIDAVEYSNVNLLQINDAAALLTGNGSQYLLNIAGFIYLIGMMIINFLLTGYIIENKIDL